MPKNLKPNHFERAGIYVDGQRSGFRFNKPYQASFMSGMLVPFGDPIPVFPGVKLDLNLNATIRTNTMVVPPLDGIYIDFFSVWIPHRIVFNHMPQFLGENDTTAWTQSSTFVYPSCTLSQLNDSLTGYLANQAVDMADVSAANLFLAPHYGLFYNVDLNTAGLPAGSLSINILPMRGYYMAWNHLFRDENYQRPVLFDKGDTGTTGEFGYFLRNYAVGGNGNITSILGNSLGDGLTYEEACLMPVNKLHDAFTSVLPEPQFGDAVQLALAGEAPINAGDDLTAFYQTSSGQTNYLKFGNASGGDLPSGNYLGANPVGAFASANSAGTVSAYIGSTNLYADLSNATAATINTLRTSVMYQRYLEALARGGRRVPEYYDSIYSVRNTAAARDYPELIARSRYMLGVNQVVATADSSGNDWSSHLGDTGAFSLTNLRGIPCCEKDFTEFGYLHIFYCVRTANRYSQMIQPHFLKSSLLDEYNPFFDHIGDVGIPNTTVNVLANTSGNFGYQEAWWDERTQLGMSVGALNKVYGSLKYWVLGEVFDGTLTTCTPSYLTFDPAIFDDLFVSAYYAYPQFLMDGLIYGKKVARMSQHSIPGIVGRI